ncbi:MAG: COX15/CtaA family protein [Acidobacteriaceae bacterium]|nr:COX15/CtaA family protein [Acidobacteriaceae bacterium]
MARKRFALFAWAVLAYNIPVILWGAYVRVSFSGDGCGAHWPFCNGQVIPQHMAAPMAIEFTHRLMTSIDTFAAIALVVWAFLFFPRRHAVRRYAVFSLVFLLIEALLGAGLVLLRYVAKDQSAGRAWYLSAHLTNTMLLLGALTATAWLAYSGSERLDLMLVPGRVLGALCITVLVSVTGAIAALGDTLFPAVSLSSGVQQDFSNTASLLVRLRLVHPAIAIIGAGYIIWAAVSIFRRSSEASPVRSAGAHVIELGMFQLAVGAVNVALLAPVWMQLFHLLVADLVWIAVVLLALESMAMRRAPQLEPAILPDTAALR